MDNSNINNRPITKQGSKLINIELKLTEGDREKLWDYCTKLDLTINRFVHKVVMRELVDLRLLSEKAGEEKHVKVKENKA